MAEELNLNKSRKDIIGRQVTLNAASELNLTAHYEGSRLSFRRSPALSFLFFAAERRQCGRVVSASNFREKQNEKWKRGKSHQGQVKKKGKENRSRLQK